jgi:hypothetical protein
VTSPLPVHPLVQMPVEGDPESYTWVDKLCDELLDIVVDKAPRWFLIGCCVLVVVGAPFWIAESLS